MEEILNQLGLSVDEPSFYTRLYAYLAKERKKKSVRSIIDSIICNEYEDLSRYLERTAIQEAVAVRHHIRVCRLAQLLIDENGCLLEPRLLEAISSLEKYCYFLGPGYHFEAPRRDHLLLVLRAFSGSKELKQALKLVNRPIGNKHAENLIRESLRLGRKVVIKDYHARQAVLATCLSYLRQNVGSCFATAPAIFIMREQLLNLIKDLNKLLSTGELKRTFGGVEYAVPLSMSWGVADLNRPFVVYVSKTRLWEAPGFLSAFEATGLIDKDLPFKSRTSILKKLFKEVENRRTPGVEVYITTADKMIRYALMEYFKLTDEVINDLKQRPKAMLQSNLMMHMTSSTVEKESKEGRYKQYVNMCEMAKNVFKSLTDNALLKTWEFTLASFSEVKHTFANWNLYSSLGMNTHEENGIGRLFYEQLKEKVDFYNKQTEEFQIQYQNVFHEVKHLENRLRHAQDEQDARWLKGEYQRLTAELDYVLEQRDLAHLKAKRFVHLYEFVMARYEEKFSEYFQEVYDADMHEDISTSVYDDSPAGFRLLYKHGRSNPASWTLIYTADEYIDCLVDFFSATEREFLQSKELQGVEEDFSSLVTEVVRLIKTRGFLESSLRRMAKTHGASLPLDPIKEIDKVSKKPWVYTSGGTMKTLLSCYYFREALPSQQEVCPKNTHDLLSFFIRIIRQMPEDHQNRFKNQVFSHLIAHSPTHAFLLMPGLEEFRKGWESSEKEDSWVHNKVFLPGKQCVEKQLLDLDALEHIVHLLSLKLPKSYQSTFKKTLNSFPTHMTPSQFRKYVGEGLYSLFGNDSPIGLEDIDSLLFSSLPITPCVYIQEHVQMIFQSLYNLEPDAVTEEMLEIFESLKSTMCHEKVITATRLREICLSIILLATKQSASSFDYYYLITKAMRNCGLHLSAPVVVADTNWIRDYFAFLVNPGTLELEFWRVDYAGTTGAPMHIWKKWLNGSDTSRKWAVYINPNEYGSIV